MGFDNNASEVRFIGNYKLDEVIARDTKELEEIGGSFEEIADRMDYLIGRVKEDETRRMKKRPAIFRKYGYNTDEIFDVPGTDDESTDRGKILKELDELFHAVELVPGETNIEIVKTFHTRGMQDCPFATCGAWPSSSDYIIRNRDTKRTLWINETTSHLARKHHLLEKDNNYGISAKEFYRNFMLPGTKPLKHKTKDI